MKLFLAISLCSLMLITACQHISASQVAAIKSDDHLTSLHLRFSEYFSLGVAINRHQAQAKHPKANRLINKHFNVLTAENEMKWESIQPSEGVFTFNGADDLVKYASQNEHSIVGHVLVWHSQTPDWVFEDENGQPASRDLLLSRMKTQIFALASRYKGKIRGWDVVNEALNEDGSMRKSKWYSIIGEDFIEKAFEFAHQADPNAELYYNDYNLFKPAKMDAALRIAKQLQEKGIRIDGIGIQAHYGIEPPVPALEKSILKVSELNLKVMITELDISVLKFPDSDNMGADISLNYALQDDYNPYPSGISQASHTKLAKAYTDLFSLFIKHHKKIDRVTFWGVSDADSWRNNWPIKGRTDYPLLFDRHYEAKDFVHQLSDLIPD